MEEPDLAQAPIELLRALSLGNSSRAAEAQRELMRRAYGLPEAAPANGEDE